LDLRLLDRCPELSAAVGAAVRRRHRSEQRAAAPRSYLGRRRGPDAGDEWPGHRAGLSDRDRRGPLRDTRGPERPADHGLGPRVRARGVPVVDITLSSCHLTPPGDPSCDTLVVLGSDTRHGHTIFAKNSDRPPTECQPLFVAPRTRHAPGSTVRCQYLEIPQVPETLAVLRSRPSWPCGAGHAVNGHRGG